MKNNDIVPRTELKEYSKGFRDGEDFGINKGRQQAIKEELKFLKERCIYCMIADEKIKQLQEEIGGNSK